MGVGYISVLKEKYEENYYPHTFALYDCGMQYYNEISKN